MQPTDFFSAEDYEAALEEAARGPANPSEARAEYAANAGAESADREYILTPWDTWEVNPYYRGPRGPHPEDDSFWDRSPEEQAAHIAWLNAPRAAPAPALVESDDVIPF